MPVSYMPNLLSRMKQVLTFYHLLRSRVYFGCEPARLVCEAPCHAGDKTVAFGVSPCLVGEKENRPDFCQCCRAYVRRDRRLSHLHTFTAITRPWLKGIENCRAQISSERNLLWRLGTTPGISWPELFSGSRITCSREGGATVAPTRAANALPRAGIKQ